MSEDHTRRFYEASAVAYEKKTSGRQPTEFLNAFLRLLPAGGSVLDVGCAYGRDALAFAHQGLRATGIDYSAQFIQRARELVSDATFIIGDVRELDIPPATFDGVWANMSLLHLSKADMVVVLQLMLTVLKSKGIFGLRMKEGEGEGLWPDHRYGGVEKFYAYYGKDELRKVLEDSGFVVTASSMHQSDSDYQDRPILEFLSHKP